MHKNFLSPGVVCLRLPVWKRGGNPRIKRPRQIQISCSTVFYGKREAKFRRNVKILCPTASIRR